MARTDKAGASDAMASLASQVLREAAIVVSLVAAARAGARGPGGFGNYSLESVMEADAPYWVAGLPGPAPNGIFSGNQSSLTPLISLISVEGAIMPNELAQADEVFLTGNAAEVTPYSESGPHHYQVRPLTRTLIEDFAKEVRG